MGCITMTEAKTMVREQMRQKVAEALEQGLHQHMSDCSECRSIITNSL